MIPGPECTAVPAGGAHTADAKLTGDPAGPGGMAGSVGRAPHPFEIPPLDIEITAGENVLWIHLRGEADLGNHQQLSSGLTRVELVGAKAVHLVLTDLTFCDLCAFRHLVDFAARVRAAGRELSAHGACPTLKKVARLLNVAHELHFV